MQAEKAHLLARIDSPEMPCPTWFTTLSSADTYWPELWSCLDPDNFGIFEEVYNPKTKKMVNLLKHPDDVRVPNWNERLDMLKHNPVMAARIYFTRVTELVKHII
jgi:hypothetical protein